MGLGHADGRLAGGVLRASSRAAASTSSASTTATSAARRTSTAHGRRRSRSSRRARPPPPTRWPTWRATRRRARRASGIERAHIVGASMGGMIAQTLAIRIPERVLSLVSIMSNTGGRWQRPAGAGAVRACCCKPAPRERDGLHRARGRAVRDDRLARASSPTIEDLREHRRAQLRPRPRRRAARGASCAAIIADRRPHAAAARRRARPTLVIHGAERQARAPVRRPRDRARRSPGARLVEIDGMGHDLPRGAWPQIIDAIAETAARARGTAATTADAA